MQYLIGFVHDAHRIELIGESLRRKQAPKYQEEYEKIEEIN